MNSATSVPSIFDTQSLTALKGDLKKADPQALKATAQQFEAVFVQMLLKSMRAATPQDGMFDSDQTRFYQEMLDAQLSQVMAAKGGMGLAAVIERQLSRPDAVNAPDFAGGIPLEQNAGPSQVLFGPLGGGRGAAATSGGALAPPARPLPLGPAQRAYPLPNDQAPRSLPIDSSPVRPALPATSGAGDGQTQAFVNSVWPHAVAASQQTGIPPHFMVAHAALESGWGRAEPRAADGRPSYNLFGIKAGGNWQGAVASAPTTEYEGGVAVQRVERFRAYGSYAEAFQDYAQLLAKSPRYREVIASTDAAGFSRGLQRAGYATDPLYAAKLERIIGGPTLRTALVG